MTLWENMDRVYEFVNAKDMMWALTDLRRVVVEEVDKKVKEVSKYSKGRENDDM